MSIGRPFPRAARVDPRGEGRINGAVYRRSTGVFRARGMTPDVRTVLVTARQLDSLLATTQGLARTGRQLDRPGLDPDIAVLCLVALRLQERNRQACRLALLPLQQRVESCTRPCRPVRPSGHQDRGKCRLM
jgi:hypothetical protein